MPSTHDISACIEQMQGVSETHPEWWADYEDAQIDLGCERDVLESLLASAPTPFAAGVLFGKIVLRQQIASVTERPF